MANQLCTEIVNISPLIQNLNGKAGWWPRHSEFGRWSCCNSNPIRARFMAGTMNKPDSLWQYVHSKHIVKVGLLVKFGLLLLKYIL